MNRHRTYRPQPAQIPADSLRAGTCDTRDPRRSMNPLAGIWATHRNTYGYREASPDGDEILFVLEGIGSARSQQTAHHSLLTANLPADFPAPPVHPIQHSTFSIQHWTYTFSAKERDSETGLSYFGSRYYSSDLSIWLSVDPMSDKYPSLSPYTYCADNPVKLVDPNGEENMYAFHYAQRYLLNKVGSVKDIERDSWYGYNPGQHRTLTKQIPTKESCYGVVWHAYMNSGDRITSYLQTGFSGKNNSFEGRTKSETWFKQGNDTPPNQDGLSRSFETDIMKGEIGDIVFMEGHAAMLAGLPEQIEEDGNTYVKLKVYTSTSDSGFIEQDIIFDSDKKNRTTGWSGFKGYGQLHQTQGKGNPDLE